MLTLRLPLNQRAYHGILCRSLVVTRFKKRIGAILWEGYWAKSSAVHLTLTAANLTAKISILFLSEKRASAAIFRTVHVKKLARQNFIHWSTHIRYLGAHSCRWSTDHPASTPNMVSLTNIAYVDGLRERRTSTQGHDLRWLCHQLHRYRSRPDFSEYSGSRKYQARSPAPRD